MRTPLPRLLLVLAALLSLSASPALAGDTDSGGGGSTGGGSTGGDSGGSGGDTGGKGGATDSSGGAPEVPASDPPAPIAVADAPPANAPTNPPTLGAGEVEVTCPSCPINHNTAGATVAGSHGAVYYVNGVLHDSTTGRPASFGPDGQAAWSAPQPGTEAFTMPDGRTAYYIPLEGGGGSLPPIVSPPVATGGISFDWPVAAPAPSPAAPPTCADIVAGGFTRADGSCGALTGPVRPS